MLNPFDPGYYESAELRSFGFKAVGENVRIAKNCTIIGLGNIEIGDDVRIDAFTSIVATGGGRLKLGSRIHIGGHCHFCIAADLTFGDLSGTSQGVRIYTASDDYTGRSMAGPMVPPRLRKPRIAAVGIGKHVIIGAGTMILPGAELPEGVGIGCQSLVRKSLEPWTLYTGNPLRRVMARSHRIQSLEAQIYEVDQIAA